MDKYLKTVPSHRAGNNADRTAPDKRPRETTPPDKSKNAKKFNPNPKVVNNHQDISTQNRFSALPVDDEDPEDPEPFHTATKRKKVNNTPPIIIEMSDNWTLQKIRDSLVKYAKEFHMTCRGNKIVRVQCYSIKSHQQMKEGLLKENIAFHTFTRRDEKLPKAVIKGLPKFTIDQIPEELNLLGFPGATVSEIRTLRPSECLFSSLYSSSYRAVPTWGNLSKLNTCQIAAYKSSASSPLRKQARNVLGVKVSAMPPETATGLPDVLNAHCLIPPGSALRKIKRHQPSAVTVTRIIRPIMLSAMNV